MTRRVALLASAALAISCNQEKRTSEFLPAMATLSRPGNENGLAVQEPQSTTMRRNPFEGNYQAIGEGRRLFGTFNCAGCHSPGGGGAIGPPLIDEKWIYGNEPAQIYESVAKGRPHGMPAFGGRVPDFQIWQLVTYVQNMRAEPSPRKER
jgi:cytochrome c oxidase cbb3-type subunit 3